MLKLKIATLTNIMGAVLLVSFVSILWLGYSSIQTLKIGGPYYQRMVSGKDLIADVLPPPLYIIEPFLEASHLVITPADLPAQRQQMNELRKAYDAQLKRWQQDTIVDPAVRDALVITANREAAVFWEALETRLYPAIEKGDKAAIDEAFHRLKAAYDSQRQQIDKVVEQTTAMNDQTGAAAQREEVRTLAIAGGAAAVVLLIVVGSIASVVFGMVRPINRINAIMQQLAGGSRTVEIPYGDRRDEIGEMAQSVSVFKDNLLETERLREAQEQAELRAAQDRKQQRQEMAASFEHAVGAIVHTVAAASTQLGATAEELTRAASHTSDQSHAVASASASASSNVQAVASAAEELSGAIREISGQVQQSNTMVGKASSEAIRTTEQMHSLSEAAKKIGGIVELINQIAAQTNLLALNATIEAARAGESGRGFAVVSQEVKQLAERTAKATGEIAAQIASIQEGTGLAAHSIEEISATIGMLNDVSAAIATAVEEQGSVTLEIARSIHSASDGTSEVMHSIQGVQKTAESSSHAASQVLEAAKELAQQSNLLQREVGRFLDGMRAA